MRPQRWQAYITIGLLLPPLKLLLRSTAATGSGSSEDDDDSDGDKDDLESVDEGDNENCDDSVNVEEDKEDKGEVVGREEDSFVARGSVAHWIIAPVGIVLGFPICLLVVVIIRNRFFSSNTMLIHT